MKKKLEKLDKISSIRFNRHEFGLFIPSVLYTGWLRLGPKCLEEIGFGQVKGYIIS